MCYKCSESALTGEVKRTKLSQTQPSSDGDNENELDETIRVALTTTVEKNKLNLQR